MPKTNWLSMPCSMARSTIGCRCISLSGLWQHMFHRGIETKRWWAPFSLYVQGGAAERVQALTSELTARNMAATPQAQKSHCGSPNTYTNGHVPVLLTTIFGHRRGRTTRAQNANHKLAATSKTPGSRPRNCDSVPDATVDTN